MAERRLINNDDFPSNANTKRKQIPTPDKEKKKVTAVVKGTVKKQKRTIGKRLAESFLGDDTRSVGDYVIHDVLVPALKSMFSDMVSGGIEMLLFGERRGRGITRDRGQSYVSYSSYYGDRRGQSSSDRDTRSRGARNRHSFDDIIFETRGEAEDVLSHLVDLTIDYGVASVADFYDLSGIESQFTDNKYGWTTLRDACTDRVRNGYTIRLPQPRPLD